MEKLRHLAKYLLLLFSHFGPSSWKDRVCKNNLLTLEHLTTTMRQFIAEISAKMLNKMDENAEAI